jgi:membrane-associated phospholipid phosphatase
MILTIQHRLVVAVLVGCCLASAYLLINAVSSHLGYAHDVFTSWDKSIPFSPAWVWVYSLNIPMPLLLIAVAKRAEQLEELVAGYVTIFAIAGLCFLVLPVHADLLRPDLSALPPSAAITAVGFYYGFDGVGNCLPSLHVAYSLYAGLWGLVLMPRRARWPYFLLGIAITISTMLVKQHFIADVITAAMVTGTVFYTQRRRGTRLAVFLPGALRRLISRG